MQDFGSGTVLTDIIDSGEAYTEANPTDDAEAQAKLAQALLAWQQRGQQDDRAFRLGPDDVIELSIFALEQPGQTSVLPRTVSNAGTISLPHLDDVVVTGLTLRELEAHVRAHYANGFLKDPEVTAGVTEYRSAPVVVTGSVTAPGVFYLRNSHSTVLEMLSTAQGLSAGHGDELLIFRGREDAAETASTSDPTEEKRAELEMISVDLDRLIDKGDITLNMTIRGGDVISVPPRKTEYVYVLGYVNRPGAVQIVDGDNIRAIQAVAERGGLSSAARADNSMLITQRGGKRQNVPVDLTKIVRGVRPPLMMKQGDILVVGSSAFAKLAEFVKVSAGASVSPTP